MRLSTSFDGPSSSRRLIWNYSVGDIHLTRSVAEQTRLPRIKGRNVSMIGRQVDTIHMLPACPIQHVRRPPLEPTRWMVKGARIRHPQPLHDGLGF